MSVEVQATNPIDQQAAERFVEQVAGLIDAGAVAAMMAIGHRTALFDTMAALPASTSAEIAAAAGLAERYVREWLAVMVTGRIVVYDPAARTYALPAEHAACLTREAQLGNMAVYTQHVALLGEMQERLLHCFRTGEGTSYDEYRCFHQIMEEDSAQTVTAGLFTSILPLVGGIEQRLAEGIDVLDAGCGRGTAIRVMAARFPRSRFVGYDLSHEATGFAQAEADAAGLRNVVFEPRDLSSYDEANRFDFITSFDAIHDLPDPAGHVRRMRTALRDGGIYLVQDVGGSARLENNLDFPMASMLYAVSVAHCMPVSLGQGGAGLGTMWGWETAQAMLEEAGFPSVTRHVLPHDPMNVWFVARK